MTAHSPPQGVPAEPPPAPHHDYAGAFREALTPPRTATAGETFNWDDLVRLYQRMMPNRERLICHPNDEPRVHNATRQLPFDIHPNAMVEPGTMYLVAPDPFTDGQILSAGKIQPNP